MGCTGAPGAAWWALGLEGVGACVEVQKGRTGFGSGSDGAGDVVGALGSGEVDDVSAVAAAAVAEAAWQRR